MSGIAVARWLPEALRAAYRSHGLWDDRGLADGLEAATVARPDALGVADNERRLSRAELVARILGAVDALVGHDVKPRDRVVLIAGNTADAVVAYHALLRLGATVLLLDRRCGTSDVGFARDVAGGSVRVIVPDGERERLAAAIGDTPHVSLASLGNRTGGNRLSWAEPDRDEPRVILFTSGTTSRPKGVVHSVNTLTAGARNMARITAADERSVIFLVSPVTSITGVVQMHLFADRHAALVLEDRFDPQASLDRINGIGATLLGGAPVIAERLLRAAAQRGERHIALRALALGGAMLPRPLLELATDGFGIEIARVYGSSEAPCATGSLPDDDRERRLADDGALMPGTEVRVGSADHPHEGLLRGPALFLGYVDAADSAAAFEDGWFRSGDLVELASGRLTVVGRLKEVANRSGLKISLSEIDGFLAAMPGIVEHACFAVPDSATGERLAVAILPEAGVSVTLESVVEHLLAAGVARRKLPEQLVVWDGALPRTPSGKVIRSRLVMDAPAKPTQLVKRLRQDG